MADKEITGTITAATFNLKVHQPEAPACVNDPSKWFFIHANAINLENKTMWVEGPAVITFVKGGPWYLTVDGHQLLDIAEFNGCLFIPPGNVFRVNHPTIPAHTKPGWVSGFYLK